MYPIIGNDPKSVIASQISDDENMVGQLKHPAHEAKGKKTGRVTPVMISGSVLPRWTGE